jgi:hypothetical protein
VFADYVQSPESHHVRSVPKSERVAIIAAGLYCKAGGAPVLQAVVITQGFGRVYAVDEAYFGGAYQINKIVGWAAAFLKGLRKTYKADVILFSALDDNVLLSKAFFYELRRKVPDISLRNCADAPSSIGCIQSLLSQGRLLFMDTTPRLKTAFETALWGEGGFKDTGAVDTDALTAFDHAVSGFARYLSAKAPNSQRGV